MAKITLGGVPCNTIGELPDVGSSAPAFTLSKDDLSSISSDEFRGKILVLNILPSIETGVCAASTRRFNQEAAGLKNTTIACVSMDLPFALKRFCGSEGIENVIMLSDFRGGNFGKDYGLTITDGAFAGLHSRVVIILDEKGKVIYKEQVPEIGQEPDYSSALKVLT